MNFIFAFKVVMETCIRNWTKAFVSSTETQVLIR